MAAVLNLLGIPGQCSDEQQTSAQCLYAEVKVESEHQDAIICIGFAAYIVLIGI